jgi:hypothetical protein
MSTTNLVRQGRLQARQLAPGEKFTGSIDFQKAGTIEMEVQVG